MVKRALIQAPQRRTAREREDAAWARRMTRSDEVERSYARALLWAEGTHRAMLKGKFERPPPDEEPEWRDAPRPYRDEFEQYIVGLKNIAPALRVAPRAVARWLEKNPQYTSLLKSKGRYRVARGDVGNLVLLFKMSGSRGARHRARRKARGQGGRYVKRKQ